MGEPKVKTCWESASAAAGTCPGCDICRPIRRAVERHRRKRDGTRARLGSKVDDVVIAPPSAALRRFWLARKGVCAICAEPVALQHATRDHVIPRSKGGKADDKNLQLTHRWCNNGRGPGYELGPQKLEAYRAKARSYIGKPGFTFVPTP